MGLNAVDRLVVDTDGVWPLPWLHAAVSDALATQKAHALLVHADPGIGALEFSLTLAQAWLCEQGREGGHQTGPAGPCGRCASCRLVQARMHPDLLLLMPETLRQSYGWPLLSDKPDNADAEGGKGAKKASRQIRIDEVRAAVDWMIKTSSRGGAKVLVLHPADQLNAQAANALLKMLEEPPAGARIVLTAGDPEHLLPTIRSRCQRVRLPAPAAEVAHHWLEAQGVEGAAVLLAACSGRPLAVLDMVRAGIDAQAWSALPAQIVLGDAIACGGWAVAFVVEALMRLCHDAMRVAAGGGAIYFPADSVPQGLALQRLVAWHAQLLRISRHQDHPWNDGLLAETMMIDAHAAMASAATRRATPRRLDTLHR